VNLVTHTCKDWLRQHFHALDVEQHVIIKSLIRPGSSDLVDLYMRQKRTSSWMANDISCGVGYASMSDLVDDYYVHPEFHNDQQLLFQISVSPEQIKRVELISLKISAAQVNLAVDTGFEKIYQRIKKLSLPFGTRVCKQERKLINYRTKNE